MADMRIKHPERLLRDLEPKKAEPFIADSCPQCGGRKIGRRNKKTGEPFWGCTNYPRCTWSARMDGQAKEWFERMGES